MFEFITQPIQDTYQATTVGVTGWMAYVPEVLAGLLILGGLFLIRKAWDSFFWIVLTAVVLWAVPPLYGYWFAAKSQADEVSIWFLVSSVVLSVVLVMISVFSQRFANYFYSVIGAFVIVRGALFSILW